MGFKKPDLSDAHSAIRSSLVEISSPYNDGWTSSSCKHELFLLKCFLEDAYKNLPTFTDEKKWQRDREQNQIVKILKK